MATFTIKQIIKNEIKKVSDAIIAPYEKKALDAYREAFKTENGSYPEGTGYDPSFPSDKQNAFQHAYTAAYIGYYMGENAVKALGRLKEIGTYVFHNDIDWGDHNRDYKNNDIGSAIGAHLAETGGSIDDLGSLIYSAEKNNLLVTEKDSVNLSPEAQRLKDNYENGSKSELFSMIQSDLSFLLTDDKDPLTFVLKLGFPETFDKINEIAKALSELTYNSRDVDMFDGMINDLSNKYNGFRGLFRKAEVYPCQIPHDPIILDLNNDGVLETTDINNGIYFDHENDGFAEASSWVGENDGILFSDNNSNNSLDNGSELITADNFADFDSNNDGIIDSNDENFGNLKIIKGDGTIMSLADAGITSIGLTTTETDITDENGNKQFASGTYTKSDGTTGTFGEFLFDTDVSESMATEFLEETEEIAELPDIDGSGKVYSLHQAMLRDESGELVA